MSLRLNYSTYGLSLRANFSRLVSTALRRTADVLLLKFVIVCFIIFYCASITFSSGLGPKVKGIQLGEKMYLNDLVECLVKLKKLPFVLDINHTRRFRELSDSFNSITIEFNGIGDEMTDFQITKATGEFVKFYDENDLTLDEILSEIENVGVYYSDVYVGRKNLQSFPDKIIEFDENRRVVSFRLHKTDFVSKNVKSEDFLRDFTKSYNIPFSGRMRGNIWYYKGEKWKFTFFHTLSDDIILFEAIREAVFD